MTPLRQEMITALVLRGYSARTRESYLAAVISLAGYFRRSPDRIQNKEITAYLLQKVEEKQWSASTLNVNVSGLRFFYKHIVHRSIEEVEAALPRARQPKRCARVYSHAELTKLFDTRANAQNQPSS